MSLIATSKLAKTVESQAVWLAWEPRRFQLRLDDLSLSGTSVDPSSSLTSHPHVFFFDSTLYFLGSTSLFSGPLFLLFNGFASTSSFSVFCVCVSCLGDAEATVAYGRF